MSSGDASHIFGKSIPSPVFGQSNAKSLAKEFVSIAAPSTEEEDDYNASAELYSDQTTKHLVVTSNESEHPKTAFKLFPEDTTLSKEMFPEENSTVTDVSTVSDNKNTAASNEVNISMNEGNTLEQTSQGDSNADGDSHEEPNRNRNEGDSNTDGDSHEEPDRNEGNNNADGDSHEEEDEEPNKNEGNNNADGDSHEEEPDKKEVVTTPLK